MKVAHIIEEVSKKNSSINNVVELITDYKFIKKSVVFVPKKKNFLKKSKVVELDLFNTHRTLKKFKPDVIHIHGLWKIFFIIIMLHAKLLKIPVIIQPHGMLLKQALKNKTVFHYFLKIIFIQIYKLIKIKSSFLAVTEMEKNSIIKIFKKKQIKIIPNPINFYKIISKKKKFLSYFGRIHKHKNVELMINSFVMSKLDNSWKFYIYGIKDDEKYYQKLKKIIKKKNFDRRIIFKKPIFDFKKKLEIMSKAYINILMSKSEIMGLSVLECLSVGTRSLVNIDLEYPKKISRFLIFSKPSEKEVSNKIKNVCKSFKKNQKNNSLSVEFKKVYKNFDIEKKYFNFLNKTFFD